MKYLVLGKSCLMLALIFSLFSYVSAVVLVLRYEPNRCNNYAMGFGKKHTLGLLEY